MKFTAMHIAQLVCLGLAGAALAVAQNEPALAGDAHAVASIAGILGAVLGQLSGSVLTPPAPPPTVH